MTKCEWYYMKIEEAEKKCQEFRKDPVMFKFWGLVADIWTERMKSTKLEELRKMV